MSTDAVYIFTYYNSGYVGRTPMDRDILYLQPKYGGVFEYITDCDIYWDKPKYTLPHEELKKLYADQVLEKIDTELWQIIKLGNLCNE